MRGFTLLECVLYIGLFGIVITGTVTCFYELSETANRNQTKSLLQAEGSYLLEKISYEIATSQSSHASFLYGVPVSSISITPRTGTVFSIQTTAKRAVRTDSAGNEILSGNEFSVDSLTFTQSSNSILTTLHLSAKTSRGSILQETFTSTTYLPL